MDGSSNVVCAVMDRWVGVRARAVELLCSLA